MSRARNGRIWALVRAAILLALQAGAPTGRRTSVSVSVGPSIAVLGTAETEEQIDCAVVAAAIDSLFVGPRTRQLLLRDSTYGPYLRRSVDYRDSLGLDESTIADFNRRNARRDAACSAPPSRVNVWILHQSERNASRSAPLYQFERPYPMIVAVSRAGVSSDHRQAVLTASGTCGPLCGSGWIVVLRRDRHDRWRVVRADMLWVS
jgi:hypothetical protein